MYNPIQAIAALYALNRSRIFSRIYDQEFGNVDFNNPEFVSFKRNPKSRVVSYCIPISETYRFFYTKDNDRIRRDMISIAFLSAFFDSVFDEDYNLASIEFCGKLFEGKDPQPKTDLERVIQMSMRKIEASIGREKPGLYDCLQNIQRIQIEGLNQRRELYGKVPVDERQKYLRDITFAKGACALLTYSYVANPDLKDPELIKDIERIGAYLQLSDDMFDIYKDSNDGNVTLITEKMISPHEIQKRSMVAFELLDKRFTTNFTKSLVLIALKMLHNEGMRKVRRHRNGISEGDKGLHYLGDKVS